MNNRYWDSNCFLTLFNEEKPRVNDIISLIEEAAAGKFKIVTSAFTIAEVIKPRGKTKLDKSTRKMVEGYFYSPYLVIRNVTRKICELSRDLVWDTSITPKDAVHVATALDAGITLFNTYDTGLLNFNGQVVSNYKKIIFEEPKFVGQTKLLIQPPVEEIHET